MKRLPRAPEMFDALELYSAVSRQQGYRICIGDDLEDFHKRIGTALKATLQNSNVLHGKRVEAMFAHVLGAIGGCNYIKQEDGGSLTCDVALNVIERADPVQCLQRDLGFGGGPDIMEVPAQVCPAGGLAEPGRAVGPGRVELGETTSLCTSLKPSAQSQAGGGNRAVTSERSARLHRRWSSGRYGPITTRARRVSPPGR